MSLEHETVFQENVAVVVLKGELVADTAGQLSDRFDDLLREGQRDFVIDMEHLDFLDSSGLGSLVRLYKRVRVGTGDVRICRMPAEIQRIFELTRLNNVFAIFDDRQSAVSSLVN